MDFIGIELHREVSSFSWCKRDGGVHWRLKIPGQCRFIQMDVKKPRDPVWRVDCNLGALLGAEGQLETQSPPEPTQNLPLLLMGFNP